MCNPTLVVAGASAVMQYQVANTQQKEARRVAIRQNELALKNRDAKITTSQRQLIEKTKARLTRIGDAEKTSRKKRSIFKTNRENIGGNTYDFLLANYYDTEGNYKNRVLGNIERSKFNYLYGTLPAIDNQYEGQSTYVPQVNQGYNALNAGLTFASTYYDYKSKRNRYETNVDPYDYGSSESLSYDGWED
jgi:hypothetical protein